MKLGSYEVMRIGRDAEHGKEPKAGRELRWN